MKRLIAAVLLVPSLIACGTTSADPQPTTRVTVTVTPAPSAAADIDKCRAAIRRNYVDGWEITDADPWPPAARSAVCKDIDRTTINRLMGEALDDIMHSVPPSS